MICSVCKRTDVRPPNCCDKCGRVACFDCMKRFNEPGEYTLNPSEYRIGTEKGGRPRFVLRELCKVCRAEKTLTEDANGSAVPR